VITIVGVGHVFDIKAPVREIIVGQMPGAVAVELDPNRYYAMQHPQASRNLPPTYRILSHFQKRLAKDFGGELGAEMIAAIDAAKEIGVEALLIDADAGPLFNDLWKEMPLKERVMLFLSAITGLFTSKKKVEKELERFSENEEVYLQQFGDTFPTLKKVLIDDRNRLMASRLAEAEVKYGSVVAIVGDGHVEGITTLLAPRSLNIIRLKQLLSGDFPRRKFEVKSGGTEVSFQFTYR
jgi:pheromone shutdown protein TraB